MLRYRAEAEAAHEARGQAEAAHEASAAALLEEGAARREVQQALDERDAAAAEASAALHSTREVLQRIQQLGC